MFTVIASTLAGFIPSTTLVRTPEDDVSIVQTDRLGGNFAYSTNEGHAFKEIGPIVENVVRPVAVTYRQPHFVPLTYAAVRTPIVPSFALHEERRFF